MQFRLWSWQTATIYMFHQHPQRTCVCSHWDFGRFGDGHCSTVYYSTNAIRCESCPQTLHSASVALSCSLRVPWLHVSVGSVRSRWRNVCVCVCVCVAKNGIFDVAWNVLLTPGWAPNTPAGKVCICYDVKYSFPPSTGHKHISFNWFLFMAEPRCNVITCFFDEEEEEEEEEERGHLLQSHTSTILMLIPQIFRGWMLYFNSLHHCGQQIAHWDKIQQIQTIFYQRGFELWHGVPGCRQDWCQGILQS